MIYYDHINILIIKHFSTLPLNLSSQDVLFEYRYDYILSDSLLTKESGKRGRNSKIMLSSS